MVNSTSAEATVAKVKVMKSGKIFLDDKELTLAEIKVAFVRLSKENGEVWYYRENPQEEPSPEAMRVIEAIVENNLPVKLSSKPDFSDSITSKGIPKE